jgi:hypothetical protein
MLGVGCGWEVRTQQHDADFQNSGESAYNNYVFLCCEGRGPPQRGRAQIQAKLSRRTETCVFLFPTMTVKTSRRSGLLRAAAKNALVATSVNIYDNYQVLENEYYVY